MRAHMSGCIKKREMLPFPEKSGKRLGSCPHSREVVNYIAYIPQSLPFYRVGCKIKLRNDYDFLIRIIIIISTFNCWTYLTVLTYLFVVIVRENVVFTKTAVGDWRFVTDVLMIIYPHQFASRHSPPRRNKF